MAGVLLPLRTCFLLYAILPPSVRVNATTALLLTDSGRETSSSQFTSHVTFFPSRLLRGGKPDQRLRQEACLFHFNSLVSNVTHSSLERLFSVAHPLQDMDPTFALFFLPDSSLLAHRLVLSYVS